jgi:hypothetical protein
MVVPAVAVNVSPRIAIVPLAAAAKTVEIRVELLNNMENGAAGQLALQLPTGWTAKPEAVSQGQEPQKGGWVTATYGKGHYTYFAYAFHRQLPFGVPGAYRLLANLLSLGK